MAARLAEGDDAALALTGQGLRDVTRVAASDPDLWVDILVANAQPVARILTELRQDVDAVVQALHEVSEDAEWARTSLREVLVRGNAGRARLPGKHGGRSTAYAAVPVVLADRPGELARLVRRRRVRPGSTSRTSASSTRRGSRWAWWSWPWRPAPRPAWSAALAGARLGRARRGRVASGVPTPLTCRGPACPRPATTPPAAHRAAVWSSPSTGRPGSGKSSVSREVARRLGLRYLDTGAMYRALTWWALDAGVDLADRPAGGAGWPVSCRSRSAPRRAPTRVTVDGRDVTAAIREPRISAAVSAVATNLEVRAELVRRQREIAADGRHRGRGPGHHHRGRAGRRRQGAAHGVRGRPAGAARARGARQRRPRGDRGDPRPRGRPGRAGLHRRRLPGGRRGRDRGRLLAT